MSRKIVLTMFLVLLFQASVALAASPVDTGPALQPVVGQDRPPAPASEGEYQVIAAWPGLRGKIGTDAPAAESGDKASAQGSGNLQAIKTMGFFELHFDPARWTATKGEPEGRFSLEHSSGDLWASVIAENSPVANYDSLKDIVLRNARQADPGARLTSTEMVMVNDTEVMNIRMAATIQGHNFKYNGYYWTGGAGTVQVYVYTTEDLFSQYEEEIQGLLNGFVIAAAPQEPIEIMGFFELPYDTAQWRAKKGELEGRYSLAHTSGELWATIIVENFSLPDFNALKDVVLSNARKVDPQSSIVSTEMRRVNGVELMEIQMEATVKGYNFSYRGYYWTGRTGTVQVFTYTVRDVFQNYQMDILDLLERIIITP